MKKVRKKVRKKVSKMRMVLSWQMLREIWRMVLNWQMLREIWRRKHKRRLPFPSQSLSKSSSHSFHLLLL